jgi:hypothetical protein
MVRSELEVGRKIDFGILCPNCPAKRLKTIYDSSNELGVSSLIWLLYPHGIRRARESDNGVGVLVHCCATISPLHRCAGSTLSDAEAMVTT